MKQYFYIIFIILGVTILPVSPVYSQTSDDLVNIESKFVLKDASKDLEVMNLLGEPEEKSQAEIWGADGAEHQTWYYRLKGLEINFIKDNTKTQIVNTIKILYPSELKTSRGIGIGSTKEELIKAYKKEINTDFKSGDPNSIVAGTEFGGVIFKVENGKVSSIFIGASAE